MSGQLCPAGASAWRCGDAKGSLRGGGRGSRAHGVPRASSWGAAVGAPRTEGERAQTKEGFAPAGEERSECDAGHYCRVAQLFTFGRGDPRKCPVLADWLIHLRHRGSP